MEKITWAAARVAAAILIGAAIAATPAARAQDPAHDADLQLGRSNAPGDTGSAPGVWFADATTNPNGFAQWLAAPHLLTPNINGPVGAGSLYYDLGTNAVRTVIGGANRTVLQSVTLQCLQMDAGLEIFYGASRIFAPAGTPTVLNNSVPYPDNGNWHLHYACRAFRPGLYTFTLRLAGAVAQNGTPALGTNTSQDYTITLRSRPTMTGVVSLPGWVRPDNSVNRTENRARVFVFAPNSSPTSESQALATTDVYLLPSGEFQLPEGLAYRFGHPQQNQPLPDGPYRIGVKPLTATGLARLAPGNVSLSPTSPTTIPAIACPLGDVNRDNFIDEGDYNEVVSRFYQAPGASGVGRDADVNGDNFIDEGDYNLVVSNFYLGASF